MRRTMRPFERVVLYIGAAKTGTTTIQNILRRNRETLFEQGFHVPRAGQAGTGQHIDLPAIVFCGESRADLDRHFDLRAMPATERRRRFIEALEAEIAEGPRCHTLLLFSEHMFYSDADEIPAYRALLSRFARRLDCVLYLRRQDRWLGSLSAQIRKTDPRWPLTLAAGRVDDYGLRVRAWNAGSDTCHIRRFETRFLHEGDLLADFARTVGLDAALLEIGSERANPSLLQEQLELMDALNRRVATLGPARRVGLRQGFVPLCTEAAGGTPIQFPRAAAEQVFVAYREINTWLHERHDPHGPPLFFDEDFDDYPQVARNEARYDEDALAAIAAAIGDAKATFAQSAARRAGIEAMVTAWIARRRSADRSRWTD